MRMRGTGTTPRHLVERGRPAARRRLSLATVLAILASFLIAATGTQPARADQAPGEDAAVWQVGWKWVYATTFRYSAPDATATLNETVTATVAELTTFAGQPAYRVTLSGTVNNGSGSASGQNLTIEGGSVSGHRYIRRSDLALLQERQIQHIEGCAGPFCAVGVTADVDLTLNPTPSWRQHDFPLNSGDSWQVAETIDYNGSFSYDAGSIGGSGSDTLNGSIPFNATAHVSNQTITAAGGSVATKFVNASSGDSVSQQWWSQGHRNDAKDYLKLPLDDATLEITRTLSSATIPPPANTVSQAMSDSRTCAGDSVTISGTLSSAASGVPVSVVLDRSQIGAGLTTVNTTTGANGAYSATLTVPAQSDGLQKNGSRANWGVLVSAPSAGAYNVKTLVVTPQNCSSIAYTGATSGAQYGSATVSAQLTDEASPSGAANRQVTFTLSGGASVNATTNASGVATATMPVGNPPRNAMITASFAGASDLTAASTQTGFEVTVADSQTSVSPSASTVVIGDSVTFTADVDAVGSAPVVPGGTVQFFVDGAEFATPVVLDANGTATSAALATGPIGLGAHTVHAVYSGDGNFAGSTSPTESFLVREPLLPTTTTQSVTPGSAVSGQTVTLSADVAPSSGSAPVTGSVTFKDGATVLGTVGLDGSGNASLDVSAFAVGNHSITAAYSGDDVYEPSVSAPDALTVARASSDLGLVSADDSTVSGEAVNLTADIAAVAPGAGVPTGAVQLLVDGSPVGDPVELSGGVAVLDPLSSLGAGDHTLAVSYPGDANFLPSTASLTQHVTRADTASVVTVTPSPSAEEQPTTITATVAAVAPGSGSPTGTVVFTANGDVIGAAPLSGGQASIEIETLTPGAYVIGASYAGDTDYHGSQSDPVSHTVLEGAAVVATTTEVTSSLNPSTYGQLITFTATVAADDESIPTGAVQFSVDGADFGDPVELDSDGVAVSPTLASPDPGDHTVIAAYLPPASYAASGATLTQTVAGAGVEVTLTSTDDDSEVGQGVTFTATIASLQEGTGTPTGFVQFRVDGDPLGDAVEVEDGEATSTSVTDLAPGTHVVTALYSGDIHFVPGSATLSQDVQKMATTTTLTASDTSTTYGDAVELTATVTPAGNDLGSPVGTVTFTDGGTTLATVPVSADGGSATATISRSDLGAGEHVIVAEYSGTAAFAASSSEPVTVTVAKRPTTLHADAALIRINPLLGVNVGTMRATLTTSEGPFAGQQVVFTNGATTVCTGTTDASGLAKCSAPLVQYLSLILAGGFTATYAGDANHLGSTDRGTVIK